MRARRVTEITIQKDEAIVIRRKTGSVQVHCPDCGTAVAMITPEEASVWFGIPVRSIYRGVEAGHLHFQESTAGSLLLCLDSLRSFASGFPRDSVPPPKNNKEISS